MEVADSLINEQLFNWKRTGTVAPGGAVLKVVSDETGGLWLASPAALFCQENETWRPLRRGVSSFWRVNTVAVHGRHIWLAGMPGGILRSANGGKTWHPSWIEQTNEPVVAIAPSPDFSQDRMLLAATDGDGILRSTDGGRHWELTNFGLHEFMVVDVVMAGWIRRYEYAFAITENGFYQSPNGGRAWRLVEMGEVRPIALLISPNFAQDKVVCVGTEAGQLFVSTDAGLSWACLSEAFDGVNGLAIAADGALIVGTESTLHRLENWQKSSAPACRSKMTQFPVSPLLSPLLSLTTIEGTLYAGLVDGLWVSKDNGRSWVPDTTLTARRMVWYMTPTAERWLAAGPEEGVWQTTDGGQTWQSIWEELPVLGVALTPTQIWISTTDGLVHSSDNGHSWQLAWKSEAPITALAVVNDLIWVGRETGSVWRKVENAWQEIAVPFMGQHLVGFLVERETLLAVVWSASHNMLHLWRWTETDNWVMWFSQSAGPVLPQVAMSEGEAMVGLGSYIYRQTGTSWQRQRVTTMDAPVTAVCALPDSGWLTAVTDALLQSTDGQTWQPVQNSLEGEPIVSLSIVAGQLVAGTADGKVWVGRLEIGD